jgi:phage baseplate assembly protein W
MYSLSFPKMLTSSQMLLYKDKQATKSNLKLLLLSDKDSLLGDPYYGTNLKKLIFDQNDTIVRDLLIDEIYTAILTFMPQIAIDRNDIVVSSKGNNVYVDIKCTDMVDYQSDLYTINLTSDD